MLTTNEAPNLIIRLRKMQRVRELRTLILAGNADINSYTQEVRLEMVEIISELVEKHTFEINPTTTQDEKALHVTALVHRKMLEAYISTETINLFFSATPLEDICDTHKNRLQETLFNVLSIVHALSSLSNFNFNNI